MADRNITVEVSTQAAQTELERLRAENAELKRDLQYAREGLTKGRSRMREDNERLAREVRTWSKAAETYAADAERLRAGYLQALRPVECSHTGMSYGDDKAGGPSDYTRGWGDCLKAVKAALGLAA